jgi:hypothetical protein
VISQQINDWAEGRHTHRGSARESSRVVESTRFAAMDVAYSENARSVAGVERCPISNGLPVAVANQKSSRACQRRVTDSLNSIPVLAAEVSSQIARSSQQEANVGGIDVRGAETRDMFLRIHIDIRQHEYKPT